MILSLPNSINQISPENKDYGIANEVCDILIFRLKDDYHICRTDLETVFLLDVDQFQFSCWVVSSTITKQINI